MLIFWCNRGYMDKLSAVLIGKALDGLSVRATIIAQNIANANSATYSPKKVTFEDELRAAVRLGTDAVSNVEPQITVVDQKLTSSDMRLDLEMASASQTSMRYAALVDILNRQMQLTRLAIRGGQ